MKNLSIVTVVYNEHDKISNTLGNIAALKEKGSFEYIIVDGESNDGTTEVIKKYSSIVDKYIREEDVGIYDAMNKGIKNSNGKYVGLLNAGDTYNMSVFVALLKLIQNETYDIIYGKLNILDEKRNLIAVKEALSPQKMFFGGPSNLNHPTFFIKKSVYKDLNYYSLEYSTASDYEFLYKAFLWGYEFHNTNKVHTNFLKGGASYNISPSQKLQINIKYFSYKPVWCIVNILKYIIIKYPVYLIIKLIPKKIHYKYIKLKNKIF